MTSFANDVNGNHPLYYLRATLSSNAGNGFQQMITINSSTYAAYEAANLSNINFQDGAGNIIPSWIESGETSGSTSTVYWIQLPNALITVVYIVFYGTSDTSKDNSVTGAEPNYTGTYAQFDNGANIFTFYDNFVGPALSANWTTPFNAAGYVLLVSNGMTLTAGAVAGDLQISSASTYAAGTYIVDILGSVTTGKAFNTYLGFALASNQTYCAGFYASAGTFELANFNGAINQVAFAWASATSYIFNVTNQAGSILCSVNYGSTTSNGTDIPTFPCNVGFYQDRQDTGAAVLFVQWARVRLYATMPTVSYGSVTPISSGSGAGWF